MCVACGTGNEAWEALEKGIEEPVRPSFSCNVHRPAVLVNESSPSVEPEATLMIGCELLLLPLAEGALRSFFSELPRMYAASLWSIADPVMPSPVMLGRVGGLLTASMIESVMSPEALLLLLLLRWLPLLRSRRRIWFELPVVREPCVVLWLLAATGTMLISGILSPVENQEESPLLLLVAVMPAC